MNEANSKKIFISYGHVDAIKLAVRLEKDLIGEGHDVWLDKSKMRDAESWEDQIEVEILNSDVFIALLSPHAVRRPDGVCLDEISLARYRHRKIIPVMVLKCQPPLGIFRLNWIDFQNWENESQYQKLFERLLKAIDTKVVVEGIYTSIFSEIKQIDFGSEIFDLIREFTGRDWLFRELDSWLEKEESRVFFITGDPGIGKSAIMAYLVHNHPQVVACHFCDGKIKDSLDTNLFIKSIAAQLATQLDNYRGALEGVNLEELIGFGDPGTLMRRLIIDPLKAEHHDKPMIILIDALDEILTEPSSNIIKILRNQLNYLPSWIRLVLSSRKEPKVVDSFSKFRPYEIEASRPENLQDVKVYLEQKLTLPEISAKLTEKGVSKEFVANIIYQKSEGNFLYVKEAIEAIKDDSIEPNHPESYPDVLIGFYMSYFERKFPDGQGYEEIRKILDIILAAQELLTAQQIGYFLDRDFFEIEQELQKLAAYFPKRINHYKVYHKALIDWLLGKIGSDTTYRVNIERGHRIISDKLYQSYQVGKIPSFINKYLLRRLPHHLRASNRRFERIELLSDIKYFETCILAGIPSWKFLYEYIIEFAIEMNSDGVRILDDSSLIVGYYEKNEDVRNLLNVSTLYFLTLNNNLQHMQVLSWKNYDESKVNNQPWFYKELKRLGYFFIYKQFFFIKDSSPWKVYFLVKEDHNIDDIDEGFLDSFINIILEFSYSGMKSPSFVEMFKLLFEKRI